MELQERQERIRFTMPRRCMAGHSAQLQMCLNQVHHCRQEVNEAKAAATQELAELRSWLRVKFMSQAQNINKLRQAAPFAPPPAGGGGAVVHQGFGGGAGIPAGDAAVDLEREHGPARPNAVLVKGPKTLNDLWQEYQHGIAGNLPAKYFNGRERGRAKSH